LISTFYAIDLDDIGCPVLAVSPGGKQAWEKTESIVGCWVLAISVENWELKRPQFVIKVLM
jgi:hypothetical protein